MNFENLKPWNWFKHEEQHDNQIPVNKSTVKENDGKLSEAPAAASKPVSSLLQLHQEVDRLFDDMWRSFGLTGSQPISRATASTRFNPLLGDFRAKLNVAGDDKEYEVTLDLPGLSQDDLQIDLVGNTLKIKGQKEEKNESDNKQYYRIERKSGSFERMLSLPEDADVDGIDAKMKNGVLTIHVPRKALPKEEARRISIS